MSELQNKKDRLITFDTGQILYPSSNGIITAIHDDATAFIKELAIRKTRAELTLEDILEIQRKACPEGPFGFRGPGIYEIKTLTTTGRIILPLYHEVIDKKLPEKLVHWINVVSGNRIAVAAIAHVLLVGMHPFEDGNGRTAHLLMNLILLQEGLPCISIDDFFAYGEALSVIYLPNQMALFEILEKTEADEKGPQVALFCELLHEIVCRRLDL